MPTLPLFRQCFQHLYKIERKRIVTAPNTFLRLNRGERPSPLPEEFRRHLRTHLQINTLQQYPSYPEFYERLSKYTGFPSDQIVAGSGIEEFIRTLFFLCCDPGQKAVVLWPSCAMFDIYAEVFGVDLIRIRTEPSKHLMSMSALMCMIPTDVRLVFIPNPGQPVETYFNNEELSRLAAACRDVGAVLAIDEAHWGFGAETALPLVHEFDNVLVLRTFSKYFSAASIRVGFAVGQRNVIRPLDAVRPSGEVTGPSMQLATMLMDHEPILVEAGVQTGIARNWLVSQLNTSPLSVNAYGRYGFSVLIDFGDSARVRRIGHLLAEVGVYTKYDFPAPVQNCMLVACGNRGMMKLFYERLCEAVVRDDERLRVSTKEGQPT